MAEALMGSLADVVERDLLTPAIPLFVLLMVVEAWLLVRDDRIEESDGRVGDTAASAPVGYAPKDTAASLSMGLGSLVVPVLITSALGLGGYVLVWQFRLFDLGAGWVAWTVGMLGKDLGYYWFHRVSHENRFLWAAHVVHHSSQHYNLSTALRQSWTPLTSWVFYVPFVLLGVNPAIMVMSGALNLIYQFWIHTEKIDRLHPAIEFVFNTPSHHRVHHAIQPQYLDRNYGGILIVWDRLFGSFEPEVERPVYGITTQLATYNPLRIATHEYASLWRDMRSDRRWTHRLLRLWRGPGWAPGTDTDTRTALSPTR